MTGARCASPSCVGLVGDVTALGVCEACRRPPPDPAAGMSSAVFDDVHGDPLPLAHNWAGDADR